MQLVAKAFHGSVDMLKLRKLAKLAIPGAIKKLVLVLPLTNPDHILLALLQGGLRVQLSGLEPEVREGEKAIFRTSRHPWVLPINLTRDSWSQFYTSTKLYVG